MGGRCAGAFKDPLKAVFKRQTFEGYCNQTLFEPGALAPYLTKLNIQELS